MPTRISQASPSFAKRFWAKVHKTDGCWLWTGARLQFKKRWSYGSIGLGPRGAGTIPAHRASWEMVHGPVPDGLCVLHKCDNQACVRPDHLFVGTQLTNVRDMEAKGRGRKAHGESHYASKLSEDAVAQIRQKYADGMAGPALGREYGVSHTLIYAIVKRVVWAHVA
jgi:hypothetical protein